MSRSAWSGQKSWEEFLADRDEEDMTIELAHEYARAFLVEQDLPVEKYCVDVKREIRRDRLTVSIMPRPEYPTFSASWDNDWRR